MTLKPVNADEVAAAAAFKKSISKNAAINRRDLFDRLDKMDARFDKIENDMSYYWQELEATRRLLHELTKQGKEGKQATQKGNAKD